MLLDLGGLSGLLSADSGTHRVWVQGGTPLHALNATLLEHGLSLSNLGDIDRQTVAGAISTGTHGTGARLGGLATQVTGLELVLADGSIARCDADQDPELFACARVGLGALGVITAVELQCEPEFALSAVEAPMPLDEVLGRIHELADAHDHFELYWFPHTATALTKRNDRLPPGATRRPLRPARAWFDDELIANTVFQQTCRAARRWPALTPRINRLAARLLSARAYSDTACKVFVSPRRVRFVESEWAIPREAVVDGVAAIRRVIDRGRLLVSFPIEVRFAAADDIPLSTAHGRDSAYLAVHMFEGQDFERYLREVEAAMVDLGGRPHWGKLHWRTAEDLRPSYPRFEDFLQVRKRVDPDGRFTNAYLERVLGRT